MIDNEDFKKHLNTIPDDCSKGMKVDYKELKPPINDNHEAALKDFLKNDPEFHMLEILETRTDIDNPIYLD